MTPKIVFAAVWVVLIEDRHADVDAEVWVSQRDAEARARALAAEYARSPDDIAEIELNAAMERDGWVLDIRYSCESDAVRVVRREVRSA